MERAGKKGRMKTMMLSRPDKRHKKAFHQCFRCYKCNNGFIGWRDDTEDTSSIVCDNCGHVYRTFSVEMVESGRKGCRTDDDLVNLMIYNARGNWSVIDMLHIDGEYKVPPSLSASIVAKFVKSRGAYGNARKP